MRLLFALETYRLIVAVCVSSSHSTLNPSSSLKNRRGTSVLSLINRAGTSIAFSAPLIVAVVLSMEKHIEVFQTTGNYRCILL